METEIHIDELEQNKQARYAFCKKLEYAKQLEAHLNLIESSLRNWHLIQQTPGNLDSPEQARYVTKLFQEEIRNQLLALYDRDLLELPFLHILKEELVKLLREQRAKVHYECEQIFACDNKNFYNGEL